LAAVHAVCSHVSGLMSHARGELDLREVLGCAEPKLVEAGDLGDGELRLGELGVRRPAPRREGVGESHRSGQWVPGGHDPPTGCHQLLEQPGVDRQRLDVETVTGSDGLQHVDPDASERAP
jgi:hypothetical protein